MAATPDRLFRRADGRLLAYNEYGDPAGRPVFFFHGYPGSRLEGEFFAEAACSRGVRLLSVDRPGYGLSEYVPWRIATWPDIVAELADGLGIERFAVAGLSGGGPYAAACAWKLERRVEAAGIISGVGPLREPGAMEGMNPVNRAVFSLARRLPWLAALPNAFMRFSIRHMPERTFEQLMKGAPASDRAILEQPDVRRTFLADAQEAFRQGIKGPARDLQLYARPWGFPLEEISAPLRLWQGLDDQNVPPEMGRWLARTIPGCEAEFIPGAGHMWVVEHTHEVLEALVR